MRSEFQVSRIAKALRRFLFGRPAGEFGRPSGNWMGRRKITTSRPIPRRPVV